MTADMGLEEVLKESFAASQDIIQFGRGLWKRSVGHIKPRMHQIVRIHEGVKNGTKRMLCADTTSAGKTLTAVAIKGFMDELYKAEKGRNAKALVVAPNQAIESAWTNYEIDKYTHALQLPTQKSLQIERGTLGQLVRNDFILVNYDKLSIENSEAKVNAYLKSIVDILPQIDLVIVDECHNLKNRQSNRSKAFTQIVEGTRHKHFLMLSASPIPNRLSDAGYLLYMLNPAKFRHYSENDFDYSSDRFSIMNAINSGSWFTFGRNDVKDLFDLPELRFGDPALGISTPHKFELSEPAAKEYFEEWKCDKGSISKIGSLSKILLRSEFNEITNVCRRITSEVPNAQIGIYSFYKDGFSEELMQHLSQFYPGEIAVITGDNPDGPNTRAKVKKRIELAKKFNKGDMRILVNTISTVSESISLITHDRPSYLIFAEPPIVPANYDQAIGRFYRIDQEAPVTVIEMMPQSQILNAMMIEETSRRRQQGIRYRTSWIPETIFESKHRIRTEKDTLIGRVLRGGNIDDLMGIADISEGSENELAYPSLLPKPEMQESSNKKFNDGLKKVRTYIGKGLEHLRDSTEVRHLIDSYSRSDWDTTSSADTNRAIVQVINAIGEKIANKNKSSLDDVLDSMKILDWGCGTACLAREYKRPITNLDVLDEMLETGEFYCREMESMRDPDSSETSTAREKKKGNIFVKGDAREMPFDPKSFDIVSSSYAIQYNAQGYQHRRDIEEILLQTNKVLKDEGYGILALPNQATSQEDIDALTESLLPRYGFEVKFADYITGHAIKETTGRENRVFQGFFLVVYQKKDNHTYLQGEGDVFVFSPYKKLGIGGIREIEMQKKGAQNYKTSKIPAETFKTSDKEVLRNSLRNAI